MSMVGESGALLDSLRYAAGSGSPVDVDFTLVLLTALFLGLMWTLNRTLFQPYLALKDARFERIQGARAAAKEMQGRAERTLDEYRAKLTDARQQATAVRSESRQEGKRAERDILVEARDDIESTLNEARADLDRQIAQAQRALNKEAEALSEIIVSKVLTS